MSPAGETASMPFDEAARCLAELGHPHRLQVFHLLIQAGDAGLSVSQIQGALGIPKSTLAHHVSALVSAGLMSQHREGRVQRCKVDAEKSRQLLKFLVSDCCEGLPDLEQLLRAGG
jgi:ArsR family transcriptional regulator, arsenate/arsenite/antimonite-responsive transcriptional repressor